LRSKLLAVPALRAKYLANVRTIAQEQLDWNKLGPIVARYRALIEPDLEADTRKLESFEAFQAMTGDTDPPAAAAGQGPRGFGPAPVSLHQFATERRKYLLSNPNVANAGK